MKKLLLIALAIVICSACSTDSEPYSPPPDKRNRVDFDGKRYSLVYGQIIYDGQPYFGNKENGTVSINILLSTNNAEGVALRLQVPEPNTKPIEGIYRFDDSYERLTFSEGAFIKNGGDNIADYFDVTDGTVEFGIVDGYYYVRFDCMVGTKPLAGVYIGGLDWLDNTDK